MRAAELVTLNMRELDRLTVEQLGDFAICGDSIRHAGKQAGIVLFPRTGASGGAGTSATPSQ